MGCSSSRNVESKKNKILEEAQQALNDRRKQEAAKTELLEKYIRAHADAKRHDADASLEVDPVKKEAKLQLARDCIQAMNDFKTETGFKPRNVLRNEPVFQDAAWSDFLDVRGVPVSQLVEMDGDAEDVLLRCRHLSASPSDALGRILLKTRETAEAALRASVDFKQKGVDMVQSAGERASALVPGRA
jgi:hypothetical protein